MTGGGGSGYDVFRVRSFRDLWAGGLITAVGMVMLMLGVSWVMTSLTDSALLVSMVQTMVSLPYLVVSIPAGVATDMLGHRTMLMASQLWLLAMTGVLAVVALPGWWDLHPVPLLGALFLIGAGVVLQQSSYKPLMQDLAGRDRVLASVSFNTLSTRIAQLFGPILGGYLMGLAGIAVLLFTRAASHLVMILALRSAPGGDRVSPRGLSAEIGRSLREGWRTVRTSPSLYGPMLRGAAMMVPCGALLGLLPLEAKENIQTGVIGYGGLLAALGLGTTAAASALPMLSRRLRMNAVSTAAIAVLAAGIVAISRWDSMLLDAIFLVFVGLSWGLLSISHQFAVQSAAPAGMRGLTTSFYSMSLHGSIAAGSFGFGWLALRTGVSAAILTAGLLTLAGLLLVRRYPIPSSAA